MSHQTGLTRAARLFDEAFGQQQVPSRKPLGQVCQNRGDVRRTRSRHRPAAAGLDSSADESKLSLWATPKQAKTRKKKAVAFREAEKSCGRRQADKVGHRQKNYPECTKDSLLQAFEKANLPDFAAIAEHELNITVDRPGGRKRGTPIATPPLSQVLRVFEETDYTLTPPEVALGPEPPARHTRSSQKRIEATLMQPISLRRDCYVRRKQATLIEPIALSSDLEGRPTSSCRSLEDAVSSPPSVSRQSLSLQSCRSRTDRTAVQGDCSSRLAAPAAPFAVPAPRTPVISGHNRRTFVEPYTLREDAFGLSFAGMTSTPLTLPKKRAFLRPNTKPLMSSSSRASMALSTGRASRQNMSLLRSQLQSAGQLCRTISCRSSRLNETVVADRDELRENMLTSFAMAFSTARLITENGSEHILTARDKVLALCSPQDITSFELVLTPDLTRSIKKIGEGSYGEIYLTESADGVDLVWKLVPFDMQQDEDSIFAQILPEVMICSSFNRLRESSLNRSLNFISMNRAVCIRGSFPEKLLHEWDEFDRLRQSENPNPREYGEDNLHLLMVLNNGGIDLEHFKLKSAEEALGVFLQTAFSLAAAESEFEFEHRDLHWGNILIKAAAADSAHYMVTGCRYEVPTGRVEVAIIDFTLSRISKDGCTVFDDLSKYSDLFTGDANVDYQFEVYRKMDQANGSNWEKFCPRSNILWLDYLLDKLLHFKKYSSRSKAHQKGLECLRKFRKNVLGFASSKDLIESSFMNEMLLSWR